MAVPIHGNYIERTYRDLADYPMDTVPNETRWSICLYDQVYAKDLKKEVI
jgi:hypothetical protein